MPTYKMAPTKGILPAVQERAQFLRARVDGDGITAFDSQDSAKLSVLVAANALLFRPAHSAELTIGTAVPYIEI